MKPPYITHLLPIAFCLTISQNISAQQSLPDAYANNQQKIIDSLTSRKLSQNVDKATDQRNIQKAVNIYIQLSKKYIIDDPISFFYYSVSVQNPDGFYIAGKELVRQTADSVDDIIANYANVYGDNDSNLLKKEPLATAIKKLKKEEPILLQKARTQLDWQWNADLKAIFKANIGFRYIPVEYFKDTASWLEAMVLVDSTHIAELCELIEKNGFPSREKVGMNAGYIRAPLKHFTGLVSFKDNAKRADYFIEKWKFLMPFLYKEVTVGQFDKGFYNMMLMYLFEALNDGGKSKDVAYFRKYELKEN